LQQFKEVIANRHEKLNSLITAQTIKINWSIMVKDIASQCSDVYETWYDWRDTISGFMFSQVVQRH